MDRNSIKLAVATALLVAFPFPGGTACFGESAQQQVRTGERLVELQRVLNEAADQTLSLLQSVQDEPSSRQVLSPLSSSLRNLATQAKNFGQEIGEARETLAAPAPESRELSAKWEQLGQEMSSLTQDWIKLSGYLRRENERVEKIRGLSSDFWSLLRNDWTQFEIESLEVLRWTRSSPTLSTREYFETKLALLQLHGAEKVVDIVVRGATPQELESQAEVLQSALGESAKVAIRIGTTRIRSVITAGPATNIESILGHIAIGRVVDQDDARRLLVIAIRDMRMSPVEIDEILDQLTDHGAFLSIAPKRRISLRNIIEQEGPRSLLAVEVRGLTVGREEKLPFRFVWRNAETGKLVMMRSTDIKGVYRGLLRYDKKVATFAKQVDYGKVESIDEEKRRVVLRFDLAKLTPKALLATRSLQEDPEAEHLRSDLRENIHDKTLEALGAGGSPRRDIRTAISDHFDQDEKTIAKLEALEERQHAEFEKAFDFTGQQGDQPFDVSGLRARHNREEKSLRSQSKFEGAMASFEPSRSDQIPSAEQFIQLAEMLEAEGLHGFNQEKAIRILLGLRPEDVADKKILRRIALGFKQLAFESLMERSDGIRGMVIWGGKHSVPPLIELLRKNKLSAPLELYVALIRLQDPRGAQAVAELLGDFHKHSTAAECLSRMGPVAEEALIEVAPSDDPEVSLTAIRLLGEVGTEKSHAILRQARKSRNPEVREAAQVAIQTVRERLDSEGTNQKSEGESTDDR